MKTFLHVGCGPKRKDQTTRGFNSTDWQELRLDIDQSVAPDIVGTMTDMSAVADASVDALFSSHNIEHLYMAHRCGFTQKVLSGTLQASGFAAVAATRREHPYYDLWALATKAALDEAAVRVLAAAHFPG